MDQSTYTGVTDRAQGHEEATQQPSQFTGDIKLATKFLLAEYETIRSFKEQSEISTDRRLDILLSLVTILGAALGFFSQLIARSDFLIVALLAVLSLIIVSLSTFRQVLSRDVITADYARALNRIRHFFVVDNESTRAIRPYILMNTDFSVPKYGRHSKSRETVVIINSLLFAVLAEIIRFLLFPEASLDLPITVTLVLGAFVTGFMTLRLAAFLFCRRAEKKANKRMVLREEVFHHPDFPPLSNAPQRKVKARRK